MESLSSDEFNEVTENPSMECNLCAETKSMLKFPKYSCKCTSQPPVCKDCVKKWIYVTLKSKNPSLYPEEEPVPSMKTRDCLFCCSPQKNYEEYIQDIYSDCFEIKRERFTSSWVLVCLSLAMIVIQILISPGDAGLVLGRIAGLPGLDGSWVLRSHLLNTLLLSAGLVSVGTALTLKGMKRPYETSSILWVGNAEALNLVLPFVSLLTPALMIEIDSIETSITFFWTTIFSLIYSLHVVPISIIQIYLRAIYDSIRNSQNFSSLDEYIEHLKAKYKEATMSALFLERHVEIINQTQNILRSTGVMMSIILLHLASNPKTPSEVFHSWFAWITLLYSLKPAIKIYMSYSGFERINVWESPLLIIGISGFLTFFFDIDIAPFHIIGASECEALTSLGFLNVTKNLTISIYILRLLVHISKKYAGWYQTSQKMDEELQSALQIHLRFLEDFSDSHDIFGIQEH